jgi:5'-nucleotidase, C-terminal domain
VSNIFFDFDGRKPSGSRVIVESVQVGDEPLDPNRHYAVGTKNYLLSGKDGFDCLMQVSREHIHNDESYCACCVDYSCAVWLFPLFISSRHSVCVILGP